MVIYIMRSCTSLYASTKHAVEGYPNPLPDMRPIVGPFPGKPGLWLDVGHHHLGLTLGPITGRLLAEIMAGEAPFVDPAPFKAERFRA